MIPCNMDSLMKFLEAQKLNPTLQPETGQAYVVFKVNAQEFPLFFRIYEGDELLQMLIFFPVQVRKERFDTMGRMLHLLNKEIDLPGFGIDETVGLVYHRIMIPVFNKKIDTHLFTTYIAAIPKICEQFYPALVATATTEHSFDELLKRSKKTE